MAFDVLEEYAPGAGLADDPSHMRPEVAWIIFAEPVAGRAEGLAGVACQDDIHRSAPRAAVEGGKIIPDRCITKGLVSHPGHEHGRGETVPLDITHGSKSGFCDCQAEIQPANAGTEGEASQEAGRIIFGM
ncbi:hypothetical protein EV560_101945 [Bosea sp. BK604]|nr:hypothetical protein EV560_101945 [Bosea sp. BK604]